MKVEHPNGVAWVVSAAVTALFALGAIGSTVSPSRNIGLSWGMFAVAVLVTVLLYRARPKPLYHLVLASSSGEVQATKSNDEAAIDELRAAIEASMVGKA